MKRDTRLSAMLHLLLHMADTDRPLRSADLARFMHGNAAAVRRTMAGLRKAGIVVSEKGHGGGWQLARAIEAVTLADIHRALGAPDFFAFGNRTSQPRCSIEQAVNAALEDTLSDAEQRILERLSSVTLADVFADFRNRFDRYPGKGDFHV
ncbi:MULTISPECIES: Rrf2 family transcriptional regulator [Nitratireductor]|uniref:Rrf2 family transcriptional regulator n=1 Tax=Nitratireductor TaxID=245876 RepID=UPI000D0D485A|nr:MULTISPECIES: Rrf2 family transcriptional regulator [Nitratireductor]PSM18499.1 transcriptional regulator [Nitratireductor sp. StC3]